MKSPQQAKETAKEGCELSQFSEVKTILLALRLLNDKSDQYSNPALTHEW